MKHRDHQEMEDHPAVVTTQEEDAELKKFMDFHAI